MDKFQAGKSVNQGHYRAFMPSEIQTLICFGQNIQMENYENGEFLNRKDTGDIQQAFIGEVVEY